MRFIFSKHPIYYQPRASKTENTSLVAAPQHCTSTKFRNFESLSLHVDSYNFVAPMPTPTTLSPMSTPATPSIPCRLLQLCRSHGDSYNFVAPSTPTTLSTSRQTPTTWQSHADKFVNSSLKFRKFEIPCRLNVVALLATPYNFVAPCRLPQLCRPCQLLQLGIPRRRICEFEPKV